MLRSLTEENRALGQRMRRAHEVCDAAEDVASTSLLQNFIDEAERGTWFLQEAANA